MRSFTSRHNWLGYFTLCMDAISHIILAARNDGRAGVNNSAVDFLPSPNSGVHALRPGCMLIAEVSTSFAASRGQNGRPTN